MTLGFHGEDFPGVASANLEDLFHFATGVEVLEFAHIGESVNIFVEIDEGAEVINLVDFPAHRVPDGVFFGDICPRIVFERFHGEGDSRVFDTDYLDTHLIARANNGSWIINKLPSELGNMHQTFDSLFLVSWDREFDEGAKVYNAAHLTGNSIAYLKRRDGSTLLFTSSCLFAHDKFLIDTIGIQDADIELLPDKAFEEVEDLVLVAIFDTWVVLAAELGNGEETRDAIYFNHKPTLIGFEYFGWDDFFVLKLHLDIFP